MPKQVGGEHYQSNYQHWDWIADVGLDYFAGNATKYVARWRHKAGVEDLRKALSYIDKLTELLVSGEVKPRRVMEEDWTASKRFCAANGLDRYPEQLIITTLATWRTTFDLATARLLLERLIVGDDNIEEAATIPAAEAVPLTEENHYSPRVGEEDA